LGEPDEVIVIGDTIYDIDAATKLGLPCFCVLTGGIERGLLERAGAIAIYPNAGVLADDIDNVLGGSLRAA
jgi:phosphoglycolate phosphatase-like HAD superfamily hydrolase